MTLNIAAIATRRIDDSLPTNVQHLMTRLACHFPVFYIEPPADLLYLLRKPRFILRYFRKPSDTSLQIKIPILLPFGHRFKLIKKINQNLRTAQIRFFLRSKTNELLFLWLFSPKDFYLIDQLQVQKIYFHVTDDYSAFPNKAGLGSPSQIKSQENFIQKKADRIFVTSQYLAGLKDQWSTKIQLVSNVADVNHFAKARNANTPIPPELNCIPRPMAGFIGAVDRYKVDFDLIQYCAEDNPHISFVFVGPTGHGDDTAHHSLPLKRNIYYLGERPYQRLPSFLKAFDVCLIPYRLTRYTQSCFPLKLYEYLAAGKPVVATNLPAIIQHEDLVDVGACPEEFSQLIIRALQNDTPERITARQKVAANNSWDHRIEQFKNILLKDAVKMNPLTMADQKQNDLSR
jgi:glycosyltransferase involved in cell wall biosynthesis